MNRIQSLNEKNLVLQMTSDGFLKNWNQHLCPHCGEGCVTPLAKFGNTWQYRCRHAVCHKTILPHACHPIFETAWGKSFKSLREQMKHLFGLVIGLTTAQNHLLWESSDKHISEMSKRLDRARAAHVRKWEQQIRFGDPIQREWYDVEADEVDLAKDFVDGGKNVQWQQWAGIVERGRPASLVLFRTTGKKTKARAPGPGPIRKKDWKPAARRWLKGRKVFLHSDGARSYKLGMNRKDFLDGVVHDYVVHKLKKTKNGNKMRAKYVQLFSHQIDGKVIFTKGGTQIIDRCWRHVGEHLNSRSCSAGGQSSFNNRIRSAQWAYWNQGEDLFLKTGEMLREM